jgi:murein DD-endopeptidase MepM/ murein hydrolase activator NlpD
MLYPNGTKTKPKVSSPYGPRTGGASSFHYGDDTIGYREVKAILPGTVIFAGWLNSAGGTTVRIDHGGGITSRVMHLESMAVRVGAKVAEGQTIGVMGRSGNAKGVNAHFEIAEHGNTTPPMAWIAARIGQSAPGALHVDGALGFNTIREWQIDLGTPADGKISVPTSQFVSTLQKCLNVAGARDWEGKSLAVDGSGLASNVGLRVGKTRTIWALQSYLGVPPDGYLDADKSQTIRRVQERLNAGRFFQ